MHRYAMIYSLFADIVAFGLSAFWPNAYMSNFLYLHESTSLEMVKFFVLSVVDFRVLHFVVFIESC